MSDIVMYLRVLSASLRRYTPGADHLPGAIDDAADEITRLRAEVARLRMTDEHLQIIDFAAYLLVEEAHAVQSANLLNTASELREDAATLRALAERHGRDAAPIV